MELSPLADYAELSVFHDYLEETSPEDKRLPAIKWALKHFPLFTKGMGSTESDSILWVWNTMSVAPTSWTHRIPSLELARKLGNYCWKRYYEKWGQYCPHSYYIPIEGEKTYCNYNFYSWEEFFNVF